MRMPQSIMKHVQQRRDGQLRCYNLRPPHPESVTDKSSRQEINKVVDDRLGERCHRQTIAEFIIVIINSRITMFILLPSLPVFILPPPTRLHVNKTINSQVETPEHCQAICTFLQPVFSFSLNTAYPKLRDCLCNKMSTNTNTLVRCYGLSVSTIPVFKRLRQDSNSSETFFVRLHISDLSKRQVIMGKYKRTHSPPNTKLQIKQKEPRLAVNVTYAFVPFVSRPSMPVNRLVISLLTSVPCSTHFHLIVIQLVMYIVQTLLALYFIHL